MCVVTLACDKDVDAVMSEPVSRGLVISIESATLRACKSLGIIPKSDGPEAAPLQRFIVKLLLYSQTPHYIMLAVPVYLRRLGRSPRGGRDALTTPHRMFLGCLIIATKYFVDRAPWSTDWAMWLTFMCDNVRFTSQELMELELDILKRCQWRADMHEHDLLRELDPFSECLQTIVWPADGPSKDTEQQLKRIGELIAHITEIPRADMHKSGLRRELDLFLTCLRAIVLPADGPSKDTEQQLKRIGELIAHITEICRNCPCIPCGMQDDWAVGQLADRPHIMC